MAKFRKKIENVEAVQVKFGRGAWPSWLDGHLYVSDHGPTAGSEGVQEKVSDGDYLVKDGDDVFVLSKMSFEQDYESARAPKATTVTSDRTGP